MRARRIWFRNLWGALFIMSIQSNAVAASLGDLQWMVGSWTGKLGDQTVQEAWSTPSGGTMSTMIRLTDANTTVMIELISIREVDGSLILHLRQFSPALELRLAQDMPLEKLTENSVRFTAPDGSGIAALTYRLMSAQSMEVDVTLADGTVLTAAVHRQ